MHLLPEKFLESSVLFQTLLSVCVLGFCLHHGTFRVDHEIECVGEACPLIEDSERFWTDGPIMSSRDRSLEHRRLQLFQIQLDELKRDVN